MTIISLQSSAGRLAGLYDAPTGAAVPCRSEGRGAPRAAVVCHPHPLGGGTKDNKVVHATAKVLAQRGLHVVRFDFRGAGGSEGEHDEGRREVDDVRAALDFAAACLTQAPEAAGADAGDVALEGSLLMVGYSFGSWVGLRAALDDPRVGARMAIAPPVGFYDYAVIAADPRPLAVVYAEADELVPPDDVRRWVETCAEPPLVTAIAKAGHLFHGRLAPLREAVHGFVNRLEQAPG